MKNNIQQPKQDQKYRYIKYCTDGSVWGTNKLDEWRANDSVFVKLSKRGRINNKIYLDIKKSTHKLITNNYLRHYIISTKDASFLIMEQIKLWAAVIMVVGLCVLSMSVMYYTQ